MQAAPVSQVQPAFGAQSASAARAAESDGFDFWDFLDIINPLQHLPVISQVYRAITGDEIDPTARLIGGGLYGLGLLGTGWIGLAAQAVDVAVEEATGDDIAGHLIELAFGGDGESGETATADGGAAAGAGAGDDADSAAILAATRPPTVVVRSDPLVEESTQPLLASAAATDAAAAPGLPGPVISPATGQALLLAAQSDDPALSEAVNRMLPRGQVRPDRVTDMGGGLFGYRLDDARIQVGRGVARDPLTGRLSTARG